jgi:hypothetical protein
LAGLTAAVLAGADFVRVPDGAVRDECAQAATISTTAEAIAGPIQNGRMRS